MSNKEKIINSIVNGLDLDYQSYDFDCLISKDKFREIFELRYLYSSLYKQLQDIKNDDNLTTFEFLKDENNWSGIEQHFAKQIKEENFKVSSALSERLFNFLLDNIFLLDFEDSFSTKLEQYKLNNKNIVSQEILDNEGYNFFTTMLNEHSSNNIYIYCINDQISEKVIFSLQHKNEDDDFNIEVKMNYKNLTDGIIPDPQQKIIRKRYESFFKSKSGKVKINKANLDSFCQNLFEDMDKTNITDTMIYKHAREKSKGKNVTKYFLEADYTEKNILNNLLVPGSKKEDVRIFIDFNLVLPMCISYDIGKAFNNCFMTNDVYSGVNLFISGIDYQIEIEKYRLNLLREEKIIFSCKDIRDITDIIKSIELEIRKDVLEISSNYSEFEKNARRNIMASFRKIFTGVDFKVQFPDFPKLSLEQVYARNLNLTIIGGNEKHDISVNLNDFKELEGRQELSVLREKMLIKQSVKNIEDDFKSLRKRL